MLTSLVDIQWAVVIAEATFKLLDPKETRSMELAGIMVDPDNAKTPLFYRLERAMRREVTRAALGKGAGGSLAAKMAEQFGLTQMSQHVKAVEVAFGISGAEAQEFIQRGRRIKVTKETTSRTPPKTVKPTSKLPPGVSVLRMMKRKATDDPEWLPDSNTPTAPSPRTKTRLAASKNAQAKKAGEEEIIELDI